MPIDLFPIFVTLFETTVRDYKLSFHRVSNIINTVKSNSPTGWSGFASVGAHSMDITGFILYHYKIYIILNILDKFPFYESHDASVVKKKTGAIV